MLGRFPFGHTGETLVEGGEERERREREAT